MGFLKTLNQYRKYLMPKLTKNIGKNHFTKKVDLSKSVTIRKILITRPNQRLGNLLLTTPLIQELTNCFPKAKIDIIVKGNYLPQIIFKNFHAIDQIIELPSKPFKNLLKYVRVWFSIRNKKYDLTINAVKGSSSGKLLTKMSHAHYKIFGEFEQDKQIQYADRVHIAKNPIYNLRHYLTRIAYPTSQFDLPSLDLLLEETEILSGKKILDKLIKNDKETISIFTYATGAKCYSKEWWLDFYDHLKKEYSSYNIIEILPMENVSQINFKAPTFYSRDIREIGALIFNTSLFIGADSGIMHLSSASKTQTIGLFSITNPQSYGPYNNGSLSIDTYGINAQQIINKIKIKSSKQHIA